MAPANQVLTGFGLRRPSTNTIRYEYSHVAPQYVGALAQHHTAWNDEDGAHGYAAYSKGFRDAQAGRDFEPINDPASQQAGSAKGGWGISSLFSLAMAGSMIFQMGGGAQGFSLENLIANAKHQNPIQLVMLASMLSNLFM